MIDQKNTLDQTKIIIAFGKKDGTQPRELLDLIRTSEGVICQNNTFTNVEAKLTITSDDEYRDKRVAPENPILKRTYLNVLASNPKSIILKVESKKDIRNIKELLKRDEVSLAEIYLK